MTVAGESSGVTDPAEPITTLLGLAGTATVFFKETTDRRHHAVLADRRLLTEATHTFLIRAPAAAAPMAALPQ